MQTKGSVRILMLPFFLLLSIQKTLIFRGVRLCCKYHINLSVIYNNAKGCELRCKKQCLALSFAAF